MTPADDTEAASGFPACGPFDESYGGSGLVPHQRMQSLVPTA